MEDLGSVVTVAASVERGEVRAVERVLGVLMILTGAAFGYPFVWWTGVANSTEYPASFFDAFVVDLAFVGFPLLVVFAGFKLITKRMAVSGALSVAAFSALLIGVFRPNPSQVAGLLLPLVALGVLVVLIGLLPNLVVIAVSTSVCMAMLLVPRILPVVLRGEVHRMNWNYPSIAAAALTATASSVATVIYALWKRKVLSRGC